MRKNILNSLGLAIILVCFYGTNSLYAQDSYQEYLDQLENATINKSIERIQLGSSPGGNDLQLIKAGKFNAGDPVIFVAANMNGDNILATEAALWLITNMEEELLNKNSRVSWYILPCGSPDSYKESFSSLQMPVNTNSTSINNDNDEAVDEDGPEDLNGDGIISKMLVEHPLGAYLKDTADSRIVRKADISKGEKGVYKLYTEGIDNDGDGKYNEDPKGGVMINRNFTYDYKDFVPEYGKWTASEPETRAIIKFFYDHPEIVATVVIGESNSLLFPPGKTDEKSEPKIKVPSYYAKRVGLDASKSYSQEEIRTELSGILNDENQVDAYVKWMLNQEKPTSVLRNDAILFKGISKQYKKHLKAAKYPTSVHEKGQWESGSLEKFSYFQMGLPTFSMDIWQLPKKKDAKEGKDQYKQQLLEHADTTNWDIFKAWTKSNHPELGEVELGGFLPYYKIPGDSLDLMCQKQLSFLNEISDMLPQLTMHSKVKPKGKNVYQIDLFITNTGAIPYPIEIGYRNDQPFPNILKLVGNAELLSGKKRTPIGQVKANESIKQSFLVVAKKGESLSFALETKNCTSANLKIELP